MKRYVRIALIVAIVIWAIDLLIGLGITLGWKTGFAGYEEGTEYYPAKTLWDWLELLIIPLVLVIGGFLLNKAERDSENKIADDHDQEIALQNYLDKMTELMLGKDGSKRLRKSDPEDEELEIARARTVTTLRQLDMQRRNILLGFLHQADLITKDDPVQVLCRADLIEADLSGANLSGADLSGADLRGASYNDDTIWPEGFEPPREARKEP